MAPTTFKGGIHPRYNKESTAANEIIKIEAGEQVIVPLLQHVGHVCDPLVKKGDMVKMGQKIGDSDAFLSSPVHASVSGIVIAVEKRLHPNGTKVLSVIIENDYKYTFSDNLLPYASYDDMNPADIIKRVKEAGIVGMGGAGFPTQIKISPPKGKCAEYIIINGAECEPYLSSDHRAMLEYPEDIILGLKIIMKATGAPKGIIAIEDNKLDAKNILSERTKDDEAIEIVVMETKYPGGSEKQIIKAVLGREVPTCALPIDVGVIVNNIDTCIAVKNAITEGHPVISRRVTLSGGAVKNPGVYEVCIGMTIAELTQKTGGMIRKPVKVLIGGPMMGITQFDMNTPIIKTSSGVLILTKEEAPIFEEKPCIKCGKCVDVCPMGLMPLFAAMAGRKDDIEMAQKYNCVDCIECGCCSYVCPTNRYLVECIRLAKSKAIALGKR